MKTIIYILIFIAALTGLIFMLPTPEETTSSIKETNIEQVTLNDNNFKLTNITVFDGKTWHENHELIVLNGQISHGDKSPNQLPEVDGNNGFVIPGLIDAHTHTWGNALNEALLFGVTTELDMFSDVSFGQQARLSRDLNEKTAQADFYSAGTLITSTGGHGTEYGFKIPTIDKAEDADQFVLDRIKEGSDYIKIVYHHKPDYHGLTAFSKEVLTAVIKAAHKYKKLAVVHISDHQSAVEAVAAGADGLVHTFGDQIISDALLNAMKEKQVFIIPTLSVIASMAQKPIGLDLAEDENLSQRLSGASKNGLKPFANFAARPEALTHAIENTRRMHSFGISILAGTDAPNPGTAHGISMHGELELLNQAGLTPTQTIQSASLLPAQKFSLGNRGSLTVGAKADFLLLSADPRKDIKNTRKLIGIWKNGYQIEATISSDKAMLKLPESGLISDFSEKSMRSFFETEFQPTSDQMMQGNSTAVVSLTDSLCSANQSDNALHVTGEIKAGFPYAWSGGFLPFSANMDQALDLSGVKSIDFDVAGSPGTYQLMVFSLNNMQPVQLPFTITNDCQTVSFLTTEHPNIAWNLVTGLAWVADRSRLKPSLASFAFKLDNVVLQYE